MSVADAERVAALLPPLLIAAERVAATVAPGMHGRRRAGQGESFWQFRPLAPGDAASRVDWRQSARSMRAFVRETEWEAAQTVHPWRDAGETMRWRSAAALPTKAERASLLLLALAALLLRGGERVALLGGGRFATVRRLAAALPGHAVPLAAGAPSRHSTVVLFGDFLAPPEAIRPDLARLAATASGHVMQILDPAEMDLPYTGHVRFATTGEANPVRVKRAEAVRDGYRDRIGAQIEAVRGICAALGWSHALHVTSATPETALLGLHRRLSDGGFRRAPARA